LHGGHDFLRQWQDVLLFIVDRDDDRDLVAQDNALANPYCRTEERLATAA
jgi:hypothetical protein